MQTIMRMVLPYQRFRARKLAPFARTMDGLTRILFAASVLARARARPVFSSHHSGLGVVVNPASVIEMGCEIGVNVVLGARTPLPDAPYLERDVAALIGDIRIGRGAVIAANALVLADVPAGSLVVGISGVEKRSGVDNAAYKTMSDPSAVREGDE